MFGTNWVCKSSFASKPMLHLVVNAVPGTLPKGSTAGRTFLEYSEYSETEKESSRKATLLLGDLNNTKNTTW